MAFPSVLARLEAGRFCPLVAAAALGSRCYRLESRPDSRCGRRSLLVCRSRLRLQRPATACAHATAMEREPSQLSGVVWVNALFNLEGGIGEPAKPPESPASKTSRSQSTNSVDFLMFTDNVILLLRSRFIVKLVSRS